MGNRQAIGHRLEHAIPPLLVAALVAAAMWSIAALGPQLPIAPGARRFAVVLLTATGVAFVMLGVLAFRASRTTVDPLNPERAAVLVTGGVYRVTRNPMYVGMAFLLLAWAVNLASVLPFLGVVVFVVYITRLQIQPEERALKGLFGDAYSRYAARVRRWL